MPAKTTHSAFTLIEMAIVVTIIGLLVAGVLVGQTMYRSAKLQQITVQISQVGRAMRTFRDTYQGLPGDITNATNYWGSAGGTGLSTDTNCSNVNSLTLTDVRNTCNGNGNGNTETTPELYRAVQQLANAGLIPGTFTGTTGSGSVPNVNAIAGPLPNSALTPQSLTGFTGNTVSFGLAYNGNVQFGGVAAGTFPTASILSPKELFAIDAKIDDGLPARGDIIAANHQTCTNSLSFAAPAVYQTPDLYDIQYLKTSTLGCIVYARNQF